MIPLSKFPRRPIDRKFSKKIRMSRVLRIVVGTSIALLSVFASLASYYWVGWPAQLRLSIAALAVPVLLLTWFLPGSRLLPRRIAVVLTIGIFFTAYSLKTPPIQSFVALQAEVADITRDGQNVEIRNFRDAAHPFAAPAIPKWEDRHFDLGQLTGGQFILQPFGDSAATVHVMTSFAFLNGDHLAVSVEARRTSWAKFDPLAGFFKHDQVYVVLGTERDLLWQRLARVPPRELYIFEITQPVGEIRQYLEKLLDFAGSLRESPQFYSTISESCLTTLLKLSPKVEQTIPWYDLRRWVPGLSVGMFQQLGIADASVSEEELIRRSKLQSDVKPPWEFENGRAWSAYLRTKIGEVSSTNQ